MANDEKRRVLGIDLGTTNSCVAMVDEYGKAQVIKNFDGLNTTPSLVSFEDGAHEPIVGLAAKNNWSSVPWDTVAFIKRYMKSDEAFKKPTKFPLGLDPVEYSAIILKKLVQDANSSDELRDDPTMDVVITVPANYGGTERGRVEQAAKAIGLNVLQLLNEPTAASLAYGVGLDSEKTILVYDLGGGTFDATILKVNGPANIYDVVASKGLDKCGGRDWDYQIANMILTAYNAEYNTTFALPLDDEEMHGSDEKTQRMYASIMLTAEQAKKDLTSSRKGVVKPTWLFEDDGHSVRVEISNEEFEERTATLLKRTLDVVRNLVDANGGVSTIDEWILVGGSSRMPQVKKAIDGMFGCDARLTDPDECVAKGAAIYGTSLANRGIDNAPAITVFDILGKTYGSQYTEKSTGREMVHNIVFAGDKLPCEGTASFTTFSVDQTSVKDQIFESNSHEPTIEQQDAKLVSDNLLRFTKPLPEGSKITVHFHVNESGLLHVTATAADGSRLEYDYKAAGLRDERGLRGLANEMSRTRV
ncbi:MAG: Hsp70 family protein [Victivallales bacterium]|nr:Hsp70 family protein [Victivallales bacterium]